jgi:pyridoxine/pyridoxamine 5'-phosphate oxidase
MVTKEGLYRFISSQKLAVVSSIGSDGMPQSAVIGIGVTPELDIVFDTLDQSRKAQNLIARPTCSLVIGWDDDYRPVRRSCQAASGS